MSALTLTLKERPAQRVDMSPLTATGRVEPNLKKLAALKLQCGKRNLRLDSLFELSGDDAQELVIKRSCDRLTDLGAGLSDGSLSVHGDTGDYLGRDLAGGLVQVRGDAGNWVGTGMRSGRIEVRGNVGDWLAGARPGEQQGLRNGTIIVHGNAGDRVGDRMRRGTVVIGGDAGEYCAARMLAGTILVLGTVGGFSGLGMRRGTLICRERPAHVPATFNDCGTFEIGFLRILFKEIASLGRRFAALRDSEPKVRRLAGDLAWGGKGEILIVQALPTRS